MKNFTPIIGREYPKIVTPLIKQANGRIDIVMYDWRWYPHQPADPVQGFNIELVKAVRRGVQVRAVLNSARNLDVLKDVGIKARTLQDKRTVHIKMLLIDDKYLIIGSHNLTRNAFERNLEASILVELPEEEKRFADLFRRLYEG